MHSPLLPCFFLIGKHKRWRYSLSNVLEQMDREYRGGLLWRERCSSSSG